MSVNTGRKIVLAIHYNTLLSGWNFDSVDREGRVFRSCPPNCFHSGSREPTREIRRAGLPRPGPWVKNLLELSRAVGLYTLRGGHLRLFGGQAAPEARNPTWPRHRSADGHRHQYCLLGCSCSGRPQREEPPSYLKIPAVHCCLSSLASGQTEQALGWWIFVAHTAKDVLNCKDIPRRLWRYELSFFGHGCLRFTPSQIIKRQINP